MNSHQLLLDRVEFLAIHVEHNHGSYSRDSHFPQLSVDDESVQYLTRTDLIVPDGQEADPRHFGLIFGIKIESESAENSPAPYDIEIEVMGFLRYEGDTFVGEDRFKCVRFSGYQILYGAIREMVSNLTARGRHGLWHLPARDFRGLAYAHAKEDEVKRQAALAAASGATTLIAAPAKKKLAAKRPARSSPPTE